MGIVIKKTISLEFLGDEYKDGYVTFKSLSVGEVNNLIDQINPDEQDNKKAVGIMLKVLEDSFIKGEFVDGEDRKVLTKDDLKDFDMESVTKFFTVLTGQAGDPKALEQ